jgi:hypothetical protein
MLMRPKRWLDRLVMLNASGAHDQGSITAEPAEEMRAERGMPGAPVTSFLSLRYCRQSFKVAADILNQDEMIVVIVWRACFLTAEFFSNQCLERIWAKLFDLSQSLSASELA